MLSALREVTTDHSPEVRYSCVKQTSSRCGFPGCLLDWHLEGKASSPGKLPTTRREVKASMLMGT